MILHHHVQSISFLLFYVNVRYTVSCESFNPQIQSPIHLFCITHIMGCLPSIPTTKMSTTDDGSNTNCKNCVDCMLQTVSPQMRKRADLLSIQATAAQTAKVHPPYSYSTHHSFKHAGLRSHRNRLHELP
jgi:hypothetical protein